jgi:hypothetical protein
MVSRRRLFRQTTALGPLLWIPRASRAAAAPAIRLAVHGHMLHVMPDGLPTIRINYLEAYCRAQSTDVDWAEHTVIPHRQEARVAADGRSMTQQDVLADGVTVEHTVTAMPGAVDFRLEAHNPGTVASEAHWAQPCVRLGPFTGLTSDPQADTHGDIDDYLPQCFVFIGGKLTRMPFAPWTKTARYMPGQVWCPHGVPRTDVNPRPLSAVVPSNGLIGCYSKDGQWLFATAWEPYQELFQGVARCLHSDFRIGGLAPSERKKIRGKIYILPADPTALLTQYRQDFPEHDYG